MKKVAIVVLIFRILTLSVCAAIVETCNVSVNGEYVEFDQPPVVVDGHTLIPIRNVTEKIGASVKYNEESRTISVIYNNIGIALQLGNPIITVANRETNTQKEVRLEVPAQEIGGRTLAPLRAIVEEFGCNVEWNEASNTVVVTTSDYVEKKLQSAIIIGE